MKKLTRKGFVAWLKDGSPRRVVGYAMSCVDCPLARYHGNTVLRPGIPKWADDFIAEVDERPRGTRLTARTCLKILGEAE